MAFNILKEIFISDVIFHHYNLDYKIVIKTDISDYMFKNILSQYNENEVLHLVVYFLKKHNSVKYNYEIYNKKFMIIIHVFKEWYSELEGFIFSIKIITDHKNLKYFIFIKQFSHHQVHWSEFLFHFNYYIIYCSDKAESKSDTLIHWLNNLFRKKNISDSYHLY